MKKLLWYAIALVFTGTLALSGTSNAGIFGSDDEPEAKSPAAPIEEPAIPPAASEKALPSGESVTLSGTIDKDSNFVADNGDAYTLSDNDRSLELKALTGKKVEIKGTVMEEEGKKTVEVMEYNILE